MRSSHRGFLSLGIAGLVLNSTQAQNGLPVSVGAPAFAKIGNSLYIQSGATSGDNLVPQFFAIDLTTSWTTSQPAWKSLAPGSSNAFHSAGYSADNSTFFTFGRDTGATASLIPTSWINAYNINSGTWTSSTPTSVGDSTRRDFFAVTNPSANKIYILGGDAGAAGSVTTNVFDTYDVASGTLTEITTPASGPQNADTYAAVWVPHLSSMLIIGGQVGTTIPVNLWVYNSGTSAWSTQATTGAFTYNRISPCAASNADGSLVAVFGGFINSGVNADPNAYILNTKTWTWTIVPYSGTGRGNSACAIIDDTFIVWGGYYYNPSQPNGVPAPDQALLLLSLSTLQWQTTYTPSTSTTGSSNSTGNSISSPTGTAASSSKGVSTAAIGGIAAGVVVALLAAGFLLYRRNKRKNDRVKEGMMAFEFSKDEEGNPRRPIPPPNELSPALYDFEDPSSPSTANAQPASSQNDTENQRLYAQSGYAQAMHQPLQTPYQQLPNQYQNPYHQTSPQFNDAQFTQPSVEGYNSTARYSNYSTPSTTLNTAEEKPMDSVFGGIPPYQQQQAPRTYSDNFGNTSSVYYPPPPTSMSQQQPGYVQYSTGGGFQGDNYTAYKAPVDGEAGEYHDSYGMKHQSIISDSSSKGKRFANAPQGGLGFGSDYSPSLPGAPQSIPK